MNEGEGSADRSAEEEQSSRRGHWGLLALCVERRMTCFLFEVSSMWEWNMPWWAGWKKMVAMALCGVTDGESKQQTELSERREEDMPVLQTPVPCHDAGTAAMPCPSSLSYSHQEKCRALHLLLKLLHRTHHLAIFLDVFQRETKIKWT